MKPCGTCAYFMPGDNATDGWCHYGPPTVLSPQEDTVISSYPIVGTAKPGCSAWRRVWWRLFTLQKSPSAADFLK